LISAAEGSGNELAALVVCLAREAESRSITLSISFIFELTGSEGTVVIGDD